MQLRTARIFVRDLPGASRFYEEVLGLPLKARGGEQGFCVFEAGPRYRELSSLGVAFSGLPERQDWGGILATLRDPSGNELQLVQQPLR